MGYWGWRPLMLAFFISVWITGCIATQEAAPTPTPTQSPVITLFVHTPAQSPTQTSLGLPTVATLSHTPSPERPPSIVYTGSPSDLNPIIRFTPTPLPLTITQPTCYETSSGGILSLGRVTNHHPNPIERVIVKVDIFQANGAILRTAQSVIEQRLIPAGESAPYRVLFPSDGDYTLVEQFGGVVTTLLRAEDGSQNTGQMIALPEPATEGEMVNGRYLVSVDLSNPGPDEAAQVRIVVTLNDGMGHILGYRVVEIGPLAAGETTSAQIDILPAAQSVRLRHTVYVEAEREDR